MTTVAPPQLPHAVDVDAVIEAARRRQRRRQQVIALVIAVVVVATTAGCFALREATVGHRVARGSSNRSGSSRTGTAIRLERPGALALGAHSALYIADDGRNQILKRLPNGTFHVVAGTGRAGFSGDGGPATRSELNMPGGMAIARDGTLYFADEGNNRIRAIAPDGVISTIVGNGGYGWVKRGTPARSATLVSPSAVTISPARRLYIADTGGNEVLRLEGNGTVTDISGTRRYAGVYGIGRPARQASPDGPSGLAFDRAGNLYLAGLNTKTLLMITPHGTMTLPAGMSAFYSRGEGDLVTAPHRRVYAGTALAIVRLTPHGTTPFLDFTHEPLGDITGFMPEGLAIGPRGEVYTDTWVGNGYTNMTSTARTSGRMLRWPGSHRAEVK